jgi:sugar phosphate isomerase/epimerase
MSHAVDRRHFLRTAGALGAAVTLSDLTSRWTTAKPIRASSPELEKLGWYLSCSLYTFRGVTCYEALDKITALGIRGIEPAFFLALSNDHPGMKTNESLAPEMRRELRRKLDERGMRMINFYANVAGSPDENRKIFEFAKEMKVETIVAEPPARAFDGIEKLCDEFQINLAVHNHPKAPGYQNWNPDNVARLCQGRSKRIGACGDTGHWVRSGLDPVECLKKLAGRIITVHLKDVVESGNPAARDVPLGDGKANIGGVLSELHRQGFRGAMSIEYEYESPQLTRDVARCLAFVEQTVAAW